MSEELKLPNGHVSISQKNSFVDIDELLNEDTEIVLFELPKGFNKDKLKNMKIEKFKKKGKQINLLGDYKGLSFGEEDAITRQSVVMFNDNGKTLMRPVGKYIKVFEALDIAVPTEDAIKRRKLKYKKEKKAK